MEEKDIGIDVGEELNYTKMQRTDKVIVLVPNKDVSKKVKIGWKIKDPESNPCCDEDNIEPDIRILIKDEECKYPNTIMRGTRGTDYCIRYYIKEDITYNRIKYPKIIAIIGIIFSIFWIYMFFNPYIVKIIPFYLYVIIIIFIMILAIFTGVKNGSVITNGKIIHYKTVFDTSKFISDILWISGILIGIDVPIILTIYFVNPNIFTFITIDVWIFFNIAVILVGILKDITYIFDSQILSYEKM